MSLRVTWDCHTAVLSLLCPCPRSVSSSSTTTSQFCPPGPVSSGGLHGPGLLGQLTLNMLFLALALTCSSHLLVLTSWSFTMLSCTPVVVEMVVSLPESWLPWMLVRSWDPVTSFWGPLWPLYPVVIIFAPTSILMSGILGHYIHSYWFIWMSAELHWISVPCVSVVTELTCESWVTSCCRSPGHWHGGWCHVSSEHCLHATWPGRLSAHVLSRIRSCWTPHSSEPWCSWNIELSVKAHVMHWNGTGWLLPDLVVCSTATWWHNICQ